MSEVRGYHLEELQEPWREYRLHDDRGGWVYLPDPDCPPAEVILELPLNDPEADEAYIEFANLGIPFTSYGKPDIPRIRAYLYWDGLRNLAFEGGFEVRRLLSRWRRS